MTVVARALLGAAERFGDAVAVAPEGGAPVTFDELWRRSCAVASGLRALGIDDGAVVALDLPSDAGWIAAYAGASAVGAASSGVNPRLAPPERAAVLDRLAPDLVLDPEALAEVEAKGAGVGTTEVAMPAADPERVACIVFTSGTTGEPKGATFRERHLDAVARIDTGSADRWGGGGPMLASTQFCHIGFTTKLPWYLRSGARLHVLERWRAADALRVVARERMTSIGGVAAQVGLLLRVPDFDAHDLSAVQTIVVGAGPSPAALVAEARARFGAAYSIRYSSTESGGVGTGTAFDADEDEALHTVGRPRPGVEVRVDAAAGGELQLRSPAAMDGYWRDPGRTAAAFTDDGWLRTGDLGEIDGRGLVRITGRASDMYIRGGYNVHPAEVEAVLLEHPAVASVAVVPRPDEVFGEIGVAVVVPTAGAGAPTVDDLRAFAGPHLASYKLPEAVAVVDELPLTSMDKLDRRTLRQRLGR
jgi:acyl-CoA synthetase (AMP-forming)/AMP-acid ligase II